MWSKNRMAVIYGLIGCVLTTTPAMTKDLEVLMRMLYAADLADQANGFCGVFNPRFSMEAGGPLGNIHFYRQHIALEVINGLDEREAITVSKLAADAALADMLLVQRQIKAGDSDTEADRVLGWCHEMAKPLIQNVISTHDEHHGEIDDLLAKAKMQ